MGCSSKYLTQTSLRLGLFDVGIDLKGRNAGFWAIGLLETE